MFNEKYFGPSVTKNINITCVVCDLNGLKIVNDNFGHLSGDELIRAAADVLIKTLKNSYCVYRIGGDEFVAIYLGNNALTANDELEKLKVNCRTYTGLKRPLSLAVGMASNSENDVNCMEDIISIADKRMYEDKIRMKSIKASEKY